MTFPLEVRTYSTRKSRGYLLVVLWLFGLTLMIQTKGDVNITMGINVSKLEVNWSFGIAERWLP